MLVIRAAIAAALLVFGVAGGASAALIYDNTAVATSSSELVDGGLFNSFTTDASGGIDSIALLLDDGGTPNPDGVVIVSIYSDSGSNTPGSLAVDIGEVSDSQLTASPSLVAFTNLGLFGPPNTRFWIGLLDITAPPSAGVSSIEWARAVDSSGIGVAGEFSADSLGTSPNGSPLNGGTPPFQMSVNTPEPASLSILGLGLAGLGLLRRRRSA